MFASLHLSYDCIIFFIKLIYFENQDNILSKKRKVFMQLIL